MPQTIVQQKWTLDSVALRDAYTDFVLSRQAMNAAPATLDFYRNTVGAFLSWLEGQSIHTPEEVSARYIRQYLAELVDRDKADSTVRDHARAIRTLVIFWHEEGYIQQDVKFAIPKVAKKRLPVLSADELRRVIASCRNPRDKAIVLFMADSGLRRAETCALNWVDVDMSSGLVSVKRGKGGKARSAVIGASTRRAILQYKRTLGNVSENAPLFQARGGTRFTGSGLRLVFRRLSKQTGIRVCPHAMRRTFVILSLRADMDVLHLQAMLGHASLAMVQHYAQMVDDDLLQAHRAHSPVDNLSTLR